jgi:putative peptidoglycan lipid II flippase
MGPSSLALQNAWLIFMLPHSILAVSIGTAYFTRFAHAAKSLDFDTLRANFSQSARIITIVMVFASGAMFSAAPFVSRVMQPGANALVIDEFAMVLKAYVVSLSLYSLLFIVQRAFYAMSDTRTPFWFTTVQIVLFSGGSLMCLLLPASIRGAGIALIFGIATLIQVLIALWFLRRRIASIDGRRLFQSFAKTAISGIVVTSVMTIAVAQVSVRTQDAGFLISVLLAVAVAAALGVLYILVLKLLRSKELDDTLVWFREKIRRN